MLLLMDEHSSQFSPVFPVGIANCASFDLRELKVVMLFLLIVVWFVSVWRSCLCTRVCVCVCVLLCCDAIQQQEQDPWQVKR